MRKLIWKSAISFSLAASMAAACAMPILADAPPDGWTDARETVEAYGDGWTNWKKAWDDTISKDWTQISLSPGSDESELNFAWYSKVNEENVKAPKLKIGEGRKMKNAKTYTAVQTEATTDEKDQSNRQEYQSNKVTATGLKEDTTYYYSYEKDGQWTTPEEYTTGSKDSFEFIYVGDPQIGSSNEKKGDGSDPSMLEDFYKAQSDAVANDSFNWNTTLNQAVAKTDGEASFALSAGDQIQTKIKDCPYGEGWGSEIEYAGYLSPDVLKNLPVATSVGNHDADNPNYTYHFNTANSSKLGETAAGGDYWFTYDNALFIMLNTQNDDVEEHKQFMEEAIAANKDCKWRIVTLHQDIYGSAEHSNEPEITNLRYELAPAFEANDVDVVLSGHDHAYSRSMIMKGAVKKFDYTDKEFDKMLDRDIDAGDNEETVYTAYQNIKDDTTDPDEQNYLTYLKSVMDADAVEAVNQSGDVVVNPEGILYMTASSSSGSKYYDLVSRKQTYVADRWQEDVPTYSVVKITDDTFTIDTYRTDTDEKIDSTFTIAKVDESQDNNQNTENNTQQQTAGTQKTDISNASVSGKTTKVYKGKSLQPNYTVTTADGRTLVKGKDYTITYKNNKKVGVATAVITGTGNYSGTKEINFTIVPKKVKIKKTASSKAGARVTFTKSKGGVTGYQVTYSLNKKFKTKKSVKVKKTSAVLKKLRSGRTYYVKVRAFKKVNGTRIYGKYSAVKKVRVR